MARETVKWMNYKLNAEYIYLGQVKGSLVNIILKILSKLLKMLSLNEIFNSVKDYSYLMNARYRKKQLSFSNQLTQRGIYVITDRYPLKEFWTMDFPMDGPRTAKLSKLHQKELDIYNSMPDYPDIAIIFKIPIKTAIERKPDQHHNSNTIMQISNKIDAINSLDKSSKFFFIDAAREYEIVRKQIKEIIWNNI